MKNRLSGCKQTEILVDFMPNVFRWLVAICCLQSVMFANDSSLSSSGSSSSASDMSDDFDLLSELEQQQNSRRIADFDDELDEMLLIVCLVVSNDTARGSLVPRDRISFDEHKKLLIQENAFKRYYRMAEETFDLLVATLEPVLTTESPEMAALRNGEVTAESQVALTLRWLAGGSYDDLRLLHGIAKSTFYAMAWRVIGAIVDCKEIGSMSWPTDPAVLARLAAGFAARSGPDVDNPIFVGCIGAVDGLFIESHAPSLTKTNGLQRRYYSGHKNKYGLNVQAVCDSKLRFMTMSCLCPGGTNDIVAWRKSKAAEKLEALPLGWYIVGDAAYMCSDHMLTPYSQAFCPSVEDTYNYFQSQIRI
eukprot:11626-Heterococcus_DN1.PRE.3